jgi:hypothetical protein
LRARNRFHPTGYTFFKEKANCALGCSKMWSLCGKVIMLTTRPGPKYYQTWLRITLTPATELPLQRHWVAAAPQPRFGPRRGH